MVENYVADFKNVKIVEMIRNTEKEIQDLFEPIEGYINFYYGKIGNGKTYAATADILSLLREGHHVYANWKIDFNGFDERNSFWHLFYKMIFFKKDFFVFPKENFHFFEPDSVDVRFLGRLVGCDVFIDEGQWVMNSRKDMDIDTRKLVLHTRHYNRSLNIISQRTEAIRIDARGNVNRFYKCEKKLEWPWLIFRRYEFQDMKDNDVDEKVEPLSIKTYFAKKKILLAYDTHAMRGNDALEQKVGFMVYELSFVEKFNLLLNVVRSLVLKRPVVPVPDEITLSKHADVQFTQSLQSAGLSNLPVRCACGQQADGF